MSDTLGALAVSAGVVVALVLIRPDRARATGGQSGPRPWLPDLMVWLAALLTLVAAAVHGAVTAEHFDEALRFGVFFSVLAAVQFALAVLLVRRTGTWIVLLAVAVNLGTVLLWLVTRTVGLPFGLAEVEEVGVADVVSTVVEVLASAAALSWLALRRLPRTRLREPVPGVAPGRSGS